MRAAQEEPAAQADVVEDEGLGGSLEIQPKKDELSQESAGSAEVEPQDIAGETETVADSVEGSAQVEESVKDQEKKGRKRVKAKSSNK